MASCKFRVGMLSLIVAVLVLGLPAPARAADPQDPPTVDDYGDPGDNTILPYMVGGVYHEAYPKVVQILTSNPNFNLSHCRTTAGTKVSHWHINNNYGGSGMPTAAQGKAYWDWTYSQYSPTPTGGDNPTIGTNCMAYAYHSYESRDTRAQNWVDPPDADPYRAELNLIADLGANGTFATIPTDRCDDRTHHVWTIHGWCFSPDHLHWKNNASGAYEWYKDPWTNDCPMGADYWGYHPTTFYTQYAIYNRNTIRE